MLVVSSGVSLSVCLRGWIGGFFPITTLSGPRFEGCTCTFDACGPQSLLCDLRGPLRRSHAHGGPLSYGKRCTNSWWAKGGTPLRSIPRHAASILRIRSTTRRPGTSTIVECCTPTPHATSTGFFAHPPDTKLRAPLSLVDAGTAPGRPSFDRPPSPAHLLRRPFLTNH